MSAASAEYEDPGFFEALEKDQSRADVKKLNELMKDKVDKHLEEILKEEIPQELYESARDDLSKDVSGWKADPKKLDIRSDRRIRTAKQSAAVGRLSMIRGNPEYDKVLYLADLPSEELIKLRKNWKPEWGCSNQKWGEMLNTALWRCSSAILATGPVDLQNRDISYLKRAD
jgi:hypothetical protein